MANWFDKVINTVFVLEATKVVGIDPGIQNHIKTLGSIK